MKRALDVSESTLENGNTFLSSYSYQVTLDFQVPPFPCEIWTLILTNLNIYSTFRFATVSQSFYQVIFRSVYSLSLNHVNIPSTKFIRDDVLGKCMNLSSLNLRNCEYITDHGISGLTNLHILDLEYNSK